MARHRAMLPVALAVLSCCVLPWCHAIQLGADSFGRSVATFEKVHSPRAPEAAKWMSWWLEGNRSQWLTLHDIQVSEDATAIVTHAGKNNQEFIDMAVMLGVSLMRHMPDHLRIALGIKGMTDDNQAALKEAGWHVVLVADWRPPAYSFNSCGDSCIDDEFMVRHQDSFERLNAFRLPVGRVLYMDADTYVASDALGFLLNSSQLLPKSNIGMVPNGCERGFSSGVMLFKPSLKKYQRMVIEMAQVLTGNATKRNDEQIINFLYEDKITELDKKFNCMSPTGLNSAYSCQKRCSEVVVSHFTGLPKPARADVESLNLVRGTSRPIRHSGGVMSRFYCDLIDNQALLTKPLQRIVSRADGCCHTPALESDPPDCAVVQDKCPAQVIVEDSERERQVWFGVYNISGVAADPVFNGGRPIYAGPRSYYLYFVEKKGNWMVGLNYSKDIADGYSHKRVQCPQDATNWKHLSPKTREWVLSGTTLRSFNESAPMAASLAAGAGTSPRGPSGAPTQRPTTADLPAAPQAASLAAHLAASPTASQAAPRAVSPGGFPGGFPSARSGGLPDASSAEAKALMKRWIEEAARKSVTASPAVNG